MKFLFTHHGPAADGFIERFHSVTKESVYIREEFNSNRIGLEHQHGRRCILLGHQYGFRNVM